MHGKVGEEVQSAVAVANTATDNSVGSVKYENKIGMEKSAVSFFGFRMKEKPDGNEMGRSHGNIVRIMENKLSGTAVDFNSAHA